MFTFKLFICDGGGEEGDRRVGGGDGGGGDSGGGDFVNKIKTHFCC